MGRTTVTRIVEAPVADVFEAVAHIDNFSTIVPEIEAVEFLSETRRGVGARFKETRRMGKRSCATELEVTEYVPGERVRLVSDQGGTICPAIASDPGTTDQYLVSNWTGNFQGEGYLALYRITGTVAAGDTDLEIRGGRN